MKAASSAAAQDWPWRRGPLALLQSLRRRLSEPRFWLVQVMVATITVVHYVVETFPVDDSISVVHHIPVILYLLPVVYASLYYGWEGGVWTAVWCGLLTVPSMVISHRADYHWAGEMGQVGVTLTVGVVLAWRVKLEAEQRQRAERTSQELTLSEQRYRSLFENAGDPILVCSRDGTIVAANEALSTLIGTQSTLAAMSISDLFGEQGARQLTAAAQTAGQLRLTLKRKDGSTAIVDAACTSLGDAKDSRVQAVLRDVTEQEQTHQALRAYVRDVTNAQEEERTRIARELHDDTAQSLVLLCRGLDVARSGAEDGKLDEMRGLADSILEGVRRFSRDLRPSILDDLGLLPAIEWVAGEASERGVVKASVDVVGEPRRLSAEAELVLFRIAQEALRNAEKHAGDCNARITIEFRDEDVQLSATDDGSGFAYAETRSAREGKLGLLGMRERAELLGADFQIESTVGGGTSVRVVLRDIDPKSASS